MQDDGAKGGTAGEKIIAYSSLLYIQTLIFGTILLLKLKFERKS